MSSAGSSCGLQGDHPPRGFAGAVNDSFEVDVDLQLDVGIAQIGRVARPQHPGDVAAEVEAAEFFDQLSGGFLPVGRRADIQPAPQEIVWPTFFGAGSGQGLLVEIRGQTPSAAGDQTGGEGAPDAGSGARRQENLSCQRARH